MSFKLPNFLNWAPFNSLRNEMKAPLTQSFTPEADFKPISIPFFERLKTGVDVKIDEVLPHHDGTLAYNGYRVLLYIRDIHAIAGQADMPKYHFAYCRALEKMRKHARMNKYVVANGDSGEFQVNVMDSEIKTQTVKLNVCQNCLDTIHWKGFDLLKMERPSRLKLVSEFTLTEFFNAYPRDLISVKPLHTSDTAPLNDYSKNWPTISKNIKMARGFQCQNCNTILKQSDSKYLHVHHRNGLKYDNSESNLDVLCIACHAEQPLHGHMKATSDYKTFIATHQSSPRH